MSLRADRQLYVLNKSLGQDCEGERPSCDPGRAIVWMCGGLRGQQVAGVGVCMFEMSAWSIVAVSRNCPLFSSSRQTLAIISSTCFLLIQKSGCVGYRVRGHS